MYTDCPSCQREFIVRARHLSVAGGQVRCGFCGRQFNALDRLKDAPGLGAAPHAAEVAAPAFEGPEPEFELELEEDYIPAAPQPGAAQAYVEPPFTFAGIEPAPVPLRSLWLGMGVVLLLSALAQLAWFNRDLILQRYPQGAPLFQRLCDRLPCEVLRYRNFSRIRLLNRDVRLHPRYQDTLLVNVTLANEARRLQAFPRLQLVLRNVAGEIVAQRSFAPREYLDESIDLRRGMLPGVPVHVALEIAGAGEDAVSFEFGFL